MNNKKTGTPMQLVRTQRSDKRAATKKAAEEKRWDSLNGQVLTRKATPQDLANLK